MKKILILGHNGMLGNAVYAYFVSKFNLYEVETISDYRWDGVEFKNSVLESDAEYVINCIGAIPQKKYDKEYYENININLPIFLESTGKKIIHPSTDCEFSGNLDYPQKYNKNDVRDAEDDYGISKALISKKIINEFKNTKIIRTSIIGHEVTESKYSLLDWFLNVENGTTINGYTNHYWNGITTITWALIAEGFIRYWDTFETLTQVGLNGVSKYELLNIFKEVYKKDVIINPFETENTINKMLESDIKIESNIKEQIISLKKFYNR